MSLFIYRLMSLQILLPDLVHADFAFKPQSAKKREDDILVGTFI